MGNTPNIRFKGFTDDWEQRKLGDVVEFLDTLRKPLEGAKRISGPYPYYGASGIVDYVNGYLFDKELVLLSEDGANITDRNYPVCFLASGKYWVNNHAHVLKTKDGNENNFICNSLERKDYKQYNSGMAMPKLNQEVCKGIPISCPTYDEQKQIGDYFRNLDHLITLHQRKCDETKKLKKFMLQNMFPKKDAKKPEIRFAGFTDDWEQRKFGDLADYKKGPFGSAITKDMFVPKTDEAVKVYEQQNAINKDWSLERYFLPKSYVLSKLKSFEVYGGDIIVSCAGTIGEIYEIPENADPGVINQALMRVRVNEDIVDKKMFIISFSNMIDEFTRTHSNGSAIKNIPPFADLKPMEVLMPSMIEQRKISDYFSNLDHLITLHQRKCDELKEFKKYMLQNMFPQKG